MLPYDLPIGIIVLDENDQHRMGFNPTFNVQNHTGKQNVISEICKMKYFPKHF
ncbi:hypothetical protein L895_13250 [Staphylococcus aureus SA16]|nr:hypothetical protein L895_13250 [Staphylococcus aureus SA16]